MAAQVLEGLRHYQEHQQAIPLACWPPEWGTLAETASPEHDEDVPMKRRTVLATSLALPAGIALETGQVQTVRDYEHISEAFRRAYPRIPARLLLPQVTATLDTLELELSAVGETARRDLLRPYAELHLLAASVARWLLMDRTAAATHTRLAAQAAGQAGDADLLAHTFAFHSYVCRLGDRAESLPEASLAVEEACRLVPVSRPASRSYVNVVAAETYAEAGDERQALQHLDTARHAITDVRPGSLWLGAGVWNEGRMRRYEAYTLRLAGRPNEAYELLGHVPANTTAKLAARSVGLAETLVALGEVEAAAKHMTDAYQQAQRLELADPLDRTRKLYKKVAAHHNVPAVRELGEALRA